MEISLLGSYMDINLYTQNLFYKKKNPLCGFYSSFGLQNALIIMLYITTGKE